jgi:hypothetical protein
MFINFSGLSNQSLLGCLARLPLSLVTKSAAVPILQGILEGRKWIPGASNHGCWLAADELPKRKVRREITKPAIVCWDSGGNVGFYFLLLTKLVGREGKVFAFELLARDDGDGYVQVNDSPPSVSLIGRRSAVELEW